MRRQREMGRRPGGFAAGQGGATALEFAFAATGLVLLVFGIIEFARMLWTQQVLQAVAAQTARCVAIASPDCPSPGSYAVTVASQRGLPSLTPSQVSVSGSDVCNSAAGTFTKVTVTYPWVTVLPAYVPAPSGGLTAYACFPHS